ncbi:MAG: hypothetical protein PHF86_09675 [Candidatus Nanoarchaeia archaeon]|nr:hypothetical protein [Candidatus Nanoarchaeia archaeon]
MNKKQIKFIKSILGKDIFDTLKKAEIGIYRPTTDTVTEPIEIKIGLQIVPRIILSWLFLNLKDKEPGAIIDLDIPFCNGKLVCNKFCGDNYSGEIFSNNKKVADFKYRTIPGIGLIIMSVFELYNDFNLLDEIKQPHCKCGSCSERPVEDCNCESSKINQLQSIIEERLYLNNLISNVVDKKISEREAINELIRNKINEFIQPIIKPKVINQEEPNKENIMESKSKLKDFLENRENKSEIKADIIEESVEKHEIHCPDCGAVLYKGEDNINLCICYGEFMDKKVKIQKSENGKVKLIFPKGIDIQNIKMLFNVFKNR